MVSLWLVALWLSSHVLGFRPLARGISRGRMLTMKDYPKPNVENTVQSHIIVYLAVASIANLTCGVVAHAG